MAHIRMVLRRHKANLLRACPLCAGTAAEGQERGKSGVCRCSGGAQARQWPSPHMLSMRRDCGGGAGTGKVGQG